MATPALPYAIVPFLARVRLLAPGLEGGAREFDLDHLDYASVSHPNMQVGAPWGLELVLDDGVTRTDGVGMDRIELRGGLLRLLAAGKLLSEEPGPCSTEVLYASPDGLLRSLLGG